LKIIAPGPSAGSDPAPRNLQIQQIHLLARLTGILSIFWGPIVATLLSQTARFPTKHFNHGGHEAVHDNMGEYIEL
jgi:hypothetical protein